MKASQARAEKSLARIETKLGKFDKSNPRSSVRQVGLGFPEKPSHPPRSRDRSYL